MENWTVEHTKEIKEWLNIDTYRKFENISLNALYHELWARALLYKPWPTEEEKRGLAGYMVQIFRGKPLLFKPEQLNYMDEDQILQSPPHVFITDITRLAQLSITALQANLISWEKGSDEYAVNFPRHDAYCSGQLKPDTDLGTLL